MSAVARQRLLWITDPWNTLDHPRDTTLRLMQEAQQLGISQAWCDFQTLRMEDDGIYLDAHPIRSIGSLLSAEAFDFKAPQLTSPEAFTQIHYRQDPPVDLQYIHPLQLLSMGIPDRNKVEVVNPLDVLFYRNEKMEASSLKELMPPSVVSSQWEILARFGTKKGRTVLKPLHQAQSHGVELLDWRSKDSVENCHLKLMQSTHQFTLPVILQIYLEGIQDGELRLWFLDGKLLSWAKKLPLTGDFRVNMDQGSKLVAARLTPQDQQKAKKISKLVKDHKIRLAAIDLIEGFITDFNFTSPGLIIQMEALSGENLARKIVSTVTQK